MFDSMKGTVTPKDWLAVLVMLGVTGAIFAGYALGVHGKIKGQIETIDQNIAQKSAALQEAEDKNRNIDDLRQEAEKIQELVAQFEKRLPTKREITSLVGTLESLANSLQLTSTVDPERQTSDGVKETIPFTVTTWGNFHDTLQFINLLEREERYFKISEIVMNEYKEGERVTQTSFRLSTFRFKEKPAMAQAGIAQ